jgi:protein-S-isoprenylcysteine O-methyltransferase Ste14
MSRLIPPILFLTLLVPVLLLRLIWPDLPVMRSERAMPWDIPLTLGLAVLVWANVQFRKVDAEIHTFRTPRQLVTGGAFRVSRNPMYLGFLLLLLAAAFYANTPLALIAPLVFFVVATLWYIPHEERKLRDIFGEVYADYAGRVRRWI